MFRPRLTGRTFSTRWQVGLPWVAVAALLSLCVLHGISSQRGVRVPADTDSLRDLGFIQGLLDGNYWGDPSYAGEWRYYPPLVHIIVAAIARVSGATDLLLLWTRSGIWLNLLTPVAFFLMCRGLFAGSGAAVAAICFYVLWSSSHVTPWIMGGYTPWPLTPSIAQTLFFIGVLAIVTAKPPSFRMASLMRAALIGLLIGLTLVAHLVPGVILTAIAVVVATVQARCHPWIIVWLGLVAVVELATAAPYLVTTVLYYPAGMLNDVYKYAVEDNFIVNGPLQLHNLKQVAKINAPGSLALLVAIVLIRRRRDIGLASRTALLAWIGVCAVFITRHYACALVGTSQARVCQIFVLTVHHYQLYLSNAWACLMGYVTWAAVQMAAAPGRPRWRRPVAAIVVVALLVFGVRSFLYNRYDQQARQSAMADGLDFDPQAYHWVLANTVPRDIFVTELESELQREWHTPAALTVMAAGRQMVAAPVLYSNPFVDWMARDARRRLYLNAASRDGNGDVRLCDFQNQHAYLLVQRDFEVRSPRLHPVYASAYLAAYRISTKGCGP